MPDPSIAEIEWRIETQRLAGSTRASVEITQLRTLIAAYKERDVLRAALKPFAEIFFGATVEAEWQTWERGEDARVSVSVRIGDVIRARAALDV